MGSDFFVFRYGLNRRGGFNEPPKTNGLHVVTKAESRPGSPDPSSEYTTALNTFTVCGLILLACLMACSGCTVSCGLKPYPYISTQPMKGTISIQGDFQ